MKKPRLGGLDRTWSDCIYLLFSTALHLAIVTVSSPAATLQVSVCSQLMLSVKRPRLDGSPCFALTITDIIPT